MYPIPRPSCTVCFDLDIPDEYDIDEWGAYFLVNLYRESKSILEIDSAALETSAEAGCPSCRSLKEKRARLQYPHSRWPTIDRNSRRLGARDSIHRSGALEGPVSLSCGWLRKLRGATIDALLFSRQTWTAPDQCHLARPPHLAAKSRHRSLLRDQRAQKPF